MTSGPSILVIDNYDSFVYNLVQYLGELGATVTVKRNDAVDASDLASMEVDGVLISPGPGYPASAGNCIEIVQYCAESRLAMLGVCLGHQALGEAFGARIVPAPEPVSYTHLDVYKRQARRRSWRGDSSPWAST